MEILPCSFHRLKTVVNIHPAHQNSPCGKAAVHHVADNVKAVVCFQKSHSRIQVLAEKVLDHAITSPGTKVIACIMFIQRIFF